MKKLTTICLTFSLFLSASAAYAGNPFTPTEKGMTLEYESKTDEHNIILRSRKTVTDVRENDGMTVITALNQILDSHGEPFTEEGLAGGEGTTPQDSIMIAWIKEKNTDLHKISEIHVSDDKVAVSMDKFISEVNESFKHGSPRIRGTKVKGYAEDLTFPLNPYAGQELASATIRVDVSWLCFTLSSMELTIRTRWIMGKERITVPAGTFDCWKVAETVVGTVRGKRQEHFTRLTWFADGIGEVRTEELDDAGNVTREVELASVIYSCGI